MENKTKYNYLKYAGYEWWKMREEEAELYNGISNRLGHFIDDTSYILRPSSPVTQLLAK